MDHREPQPLQSRLKGLGKTSISLANDIGATLFADPDLVHTAGVDVDSTSNTKRLLLRLLIVGIRDGQLSSSDEMGCQPAVRMRRIVGLPERSTQREAHSSVGREEETHGPSVQVKTCLNPHDRTSAS